MTPDLTNTDCATCQWREGMRCMGHRVPGMSGVWRAPTMAEVYPLDSWFRYRSYLPAEFRTLRHPLSCPLHSHEQLALWKRIGQQLL